LIDGEDANRYPIFLRFQGGVQGEIGDGRIVAGNGAQRLLIVTDEAALARKFSRNAQCEF
jgi:hypothetical protein